MPALVYELNIRNNTSGSFEEVKKGSKESTQNVSELSKAMKELGKSVSYNVAGEIKGLGKELGKLKEKQFSLGSLFKDTIGKMVSLAMAAIKVQMTLALAGLVLNNIGKIGDVVGTKFVRTGALINSFGGAIEKAFSKLGKSAGEGTAAIVKTLPFTKNLFDIVKQMANVFTAGTLAMAQNKAVLADMPIHLQSLGIALFKVSYRLGNLVTSLTSTSQLFQKVISTIITVGGNVIKWGSKIIGFFLKFPLVIGGAVIALITLAKTFKSIISTANELDALDDASRKLGLSAASYKAWNYELVKSGSSIEGISSLIGNLDRHILDAANDTGPLNTVFKELGITALDNQGYLKGNEVLFTDIIQKLADMEDRSLRNAYASEIFGKQYREIIPLLDNYNSSAKDNIANTLKLTDTFNKGTAAGSEFKDNIDDMKKGMDVAKVSLFTGTINRLSDTLNLIKKSNLEQVFYGIAAVLMWLVNVIIDAFNAILGTITSTISSIIAGYQKLITLVLMGYFNLINTINNNPIGDKLIPDDVVKSAREAFITMADIADQSAKDAADSWKQTGESVLQFLSLGAINFAPGSTNTEGKTKPPKRTKDKKSGEPIYNDFIQDIKVFQQFNDQRQQLLAQFSEWSIGNIENQVKRERAILTQEYEKRQQDIYDAETWGTASATQITMAKADLETWYTNEKRKLSIEGTKTVIDNMIKEREEAKRTVESIIDSYRSMFSGLQSNWNILIDLMKQASNADINMLDNMSSILDGVNESLDIISQQIIEQDFSFQSWIASAQALASVVTSTMANIVATNNQHMMDSVNKWYETEKDKIEKSTKNHKKRDKELANLDKERATREEAARKKAFENQKAIGIVAAIINTAVGVARAFADYAYPESLLVGALVLAGGVAQVATIAAQQYADGGIVPGNSYSGDKQTAKVNSGEMILNKEQQSNLFNMINRGNSGNNIIDASINISGNADSSTIELLNEYSIEQEKRLLAGLEQLKYNGKLQRVINVY